MLAASPYAWQADLDTTLVVPVLALAYLFLAGRYGTTADRAASFGGALVLLAAAFWTPIHHLGLHYLLSAHLLQNVILAEWAPLLAVLGDLTGDGRRRRAPAGLARAHAPVRRAAGLARELLRLASCRSSTTARCATRAR